MFLSSCGTNSGGSSSQPVVLTGVFIDSPVANINYVSEGVIAMTDNSGQFNCNLGSDITFYLDDGSNRTLLLGTLSCRAVVSPMELITNDAFNVTSSLGELPPEQQISVARFLRIIQSLDVDSNPDNGISLNQSNLVLMMDYLENADNNSAEVRHNFKDSLASLLNPSLFNDAEFDTELSAIMTYMARSGDEVSEADALNHFNNYRAACTLDGCDDGVSNTSPLAVTQPEHVCLIGSTIASNEEMRDSVINSQNGDYRVFPGSQEIYQDLFMTTTVIILYNTGSSPALVLRRKVPGEVDYLANLNLDDYYQWDASWRYDEASGRLSVSGIPFNNGRETWEFSDFNNLSASYPSMYPTSAGLELEAEDLIWYSELNCPLPEINL